MNDHPNPLSSMPLALLDGATIDAARDLHRVALFGRGKLGDPSMELGVRESAQHRWVYFPLMTLDEAIVMKQFEWETALGPDQGRRYRCPLHVAFRDPSAPESSKLQRRAAHTYRYQAWSDLSLRLVHEPRVVSHERGVRVSALWGGRAPPFTCVALSSSVSVRARVTAGLVVR